jgi:hypothetical protein
MYYHQYMKNCNPICTWNHCLCVLRCDCL